MKLHKSSLALMGIMFTGAVVASVTEYTNPVSPGDMPDPTIWQGNGKYYAASTGQTIYESGNLVDWFETGNRLLEAEEYEWIRSKNDYSGVWAPDVVKFGEWYHLYICFWNRGNHTMIACYRSKNPAGPFTDRAVILTSEGAGKHEVIDPEVVRDPATGRVWMFFGHGSVRRVELNADGRSVKKGAPIVHVAGIARGEPRPKADSPVYGSQFCEGPYLHFNNGKWYMFVSHGAWGDHTYRMLVGRADSLDGEFLDKQGRKLSEGWGTLVLSSGKDDELYGPGHNGEIFVTPSGRNFMLYHCHTKKMKPSARPMCLQEIFWGADGWPYFGNGGKPVQKGEIDLAAIPLPEHPRPDWERKDWINLNGRWDFRFDTEREYSHKILVPFGWGSGLSGVENKGDIGWYRRNLNIPTSWKGKRVFLVIGASDHDTTVNFAGRNLGTHVGGYVPFEFELTEMVKHGENQPLEIKVWDPSDEISREGYYLYGKQGYGNARGIWQTVYLEARGETYADSVRFIPDIKSGSVTANVIMPSPVTKDVKASIEVNGQKCDFTVSKGAIAATAVIKLNNPRLWELDDPYLYDAKVTVGDDSVKSYFGLREFGVAMNDPVGMNYVTLNGKPIYFRLCLDQSYHPRGWYTFPCDEFMKNEMLISKRLALNGNRVHIKVELPRKLYWADKLGLLIQADVPCAWGNVSDKMFEEHWSCFTGMVKRDFNHPSIYQWTLFNETWGLFHNRSLNMGLAAGGGKQRAYGSDTQGRVAEAYRMAKLLDPTRMVEDNSPCHNDHVMTDVNTWHRYCAGRYWDEVVAYVCTNTYNGSKYNFIGGNVQGDQPMMNSECGNVWGYSGSTGDCDFTWDYHLMMDAFRRYLKCSGWLYTEHHDVINEWNGYVRYDRSPKYTGIEELFPGMSLKDLHADAYMPLDKELCRISAPGEARVIPVGISLVTDKLAGRKLSLGYAMRYFDDRGELRNVEFKKIENLGLAKSWQSGKLVDVTVKLPMTSAAGTVNFTLYADGEPVARNFTCFRVKRNDEVDARPVAESWTKGSAKVLGGLKHNGFGYGWFEYEFNAPEGGTFIAEVSAKRRNGKDVKDGKTRNTLDYMLGGGFADRSKNPNSYPQTAMYKHACFVNVYANGELVATVFLPNDPADHRGILSWASQPNENKLHEAGSYGYLVKAEIPKRLVKDGKVRIRLENQGGFAVSEGLAVYGPDFGRYPFGPQIVK